MEFRRRFSTTFGVPCPESVNRQCAKSIGKILMNLSPKKCSTWIQLKLHTPRTGFAWEILSSKSFIFVFSSFADFRGLERCQ